MKSWILGQLKQPSTWRGVAWLLTAVGVGLSPEQMEAIITAGMMAAGALGVILNDNSK